MTLRRATGCITGLSVLLLAGCAPFRYSEFTGHRVWPATTGAMADNNYAITVYRGIPERPYIVVGSIQFADPDSRWDDGDTARAARLAKRKGGDAIIMRYGPEYGIRTIVGAAADANILSMPQVAALVIRWRPLSEIKAETEALASFHKDIQRKHPDESISEDLLNIAAEYVRWSGLDLSTPQGIEKLEQALSSIRNSGNKDSSGKWLFKGTTKASALTSTTTDLFYGIVTVSQKGDTIAIVSPPGRVELSFTGKSVEGRLSGRLGLSADSTILSGDADGVVVADKISLSAQGRTSDGLIQSNFHFYR